jgi:hypothetical protein
MPSSRSDSYPGRVLDRGQDYNWQDEIQWTTLPFYDWNSTDYGSTHYREVMSHSNDRFLSDSPSTNAHETKHGLSHEMRQATSAEDEFIYFAGDKGAYFVEPQMHARFIKYYLPSRVKEMARGRYQLYLEQQVEKYWSNVGNQFDEWNAYLTTSKVALEMYQAQTWPGTRQDVADGSMDFLYFCSAALVALNEREPEYLKQNRQFLAIYAMLAEETMILVTQLNNIDLFNRFHSKPLLEHFLYSFDNSESRELLKKIYGASWTKRVFNF